MALPDLTLVQFVDAVGRDQPAPGCGAAAALSLALAAACARKALLITARRRGGDPPMEAAAERCRVLAELALAGVQRDAAHFRAYIEAGPRNQEPTVALEKDAQDLMGLAAELDGLLRRHADAIHPAVQADAAAAAVLIEAFERIERRNLQEFSDC